MKENSSYERWVWTELLGFDADQEDGGIGAYLETLGFVPDGVSLLIGAPDMVLQHEGLESDAVLPPDFCARLGHAGNEVRPRQAWTRFQLRSLVTSLQAAGCQVYFSVFTDCLKDEFHKEWLTQHPECKGRWVDSGPREAVFVLSRLADGSYLQDFFATQLERVCLDYGFDGWHGADGYGPLKPTHIVGFDDDFFGQFVDRGQSGLPADILEPTEDDPKKMTRRRDWIWRHRRQEWITFYADRWAEFWQVVVAALHGIDRKAMINSAWTRDPFEALYRYGVDYRKIAATGVDAMMVETCAGGILLGSNERDYHYDYLAMLMHIKACVPEMKLIFLHNTKDVAEDWDLLRHAPAMLQREVYALANVFHGGSGGQISRCVDGFLACLADGISGPEWEWLAGQWAFSFGERPRRVPGWKLLWSEAGMDSHLKDFPSKREASSHYLCYHLMEANTPIGMTVAIADMADHEGPFLLINPQHISEEEKEIVRRAEACVAVLGPDLNGWPESPLELRDGDGAQAMTLRVYGAASLENDKYEGLAGSLTGPTEKLPEDPLSLEEPVPFRAELVFAPLSQAFLSAVAETLRLVCGEFSVENQTPDNLVVLPPLRIGIMLSEEKENTLRVAVKNSAGIYARPRIDLGRPIEAVKIRSGFPVTRVKPCDGKFEIVVPPCGIVVADITMKTNLKTAQPAETMKEKIS